MCSIYGWTKEYIVNNLTWKQFLIFYRYGRQYDYEKRGWKFDNVKEQRDELVDIYYTDEEKKEREKWLKGQFGEDVKGL